MHAWKDWNWNQIALHGRVLAVAMLWICRAKYIRRLLLLVALLVALYILHHRISAVMSAAGIERAENTRENNDSQIKDISNKEISLFSTSSQNISHTSLIIGQHSSHIKSAISLQSRDNSTTSTTLSMLEELQRCSRALGVSEQSLLISRDAITEVSWRAKTFLRKIKSLLPLSFSSQYRNPCWTAERLKFSSAQIKRVMSYFLPDTARKMKPGLEGQYAKYLSKPIDGNSTSKKILLCLPYFFLAGFPKSATTTVHHMLTELQGIVAPQGKEPHWWTRALSLAKSEKFAPEYIPIAFMSYARFFETISSRLTAESNSVKPNMRLITYDGSQSTLWDSNFFYSGQDFCAMPAIISRVLPNAKFIVVMRNPATRLYSHFMYSCKLHHGKVENWPPEIKLNGAKLFHKQVTKDITDFNECLERMSTFECASSSISQSIGTAACGAVRHRLAIGLYVVHIKKWLQFYPRENFLFLKMEDLTEDARGTTSQITNFLDLSPLSEEKVGADKLFGRENTLNDKSHDFQQMEERTKSLLDDFYRPFNEALVALLNDDRYLWKL